VHGRLTSGHKVTGCSSGIGLALAQLITEKKSYRLVATARDPSSLLGLPSTPNLLKLALDVTSQASVDAAVATALQTFGRLDVVVNNAGYGLQGDTENATEEQERRQMETLFWGTARITKHAMRVMRENGGGLVMNVTSVGGFAGLPGNALYHAGKFAVEGFTESVAKEVRPEWNSEYSLSEKSSPLEAVLLITKTS
jgi:NAD(P)-dependent dehydrogenase (short-subunit alcohol dehydrogenase family)